MTQVGAPPSRNPSLPLPIHAPLLLLLLFVLLHLLLRAPWPRCHCLVSCARARACAGARTLTDAPVARRRAGCDAVCTRSGRTDGHRDLSRLIKLPVSRAGPPTGIGFVLYFVLFLKKKKKDTCYCVSRSQFGSGRGCNSCSRRRKRRSMGLFLLTAARLPHWHKHQGAGGELSPSIQLPVSVLCPRTITVLCWPKHVLSSVEVGGIFFASLLFTAVDWFSHNFCCLFVFITLAWHRWH